VRCAGEHAHVHADLGDDLLGADRADAWDAVELGDLGGVRAVGCPVRAAACPDAARRYEAQRDGGRDASRPNRGSASFACEDAPVGSAGVAVDGELARLRRELEWLRAENARLSRLLDLRGLDTSPAPEQLSAAVAAPGAVTMASPVADKLALFALLFCARSDVYAVRWENARTGSGWMPAVAGGWRKGMDRRNATYLALTAEVVAEHLVGNVFLGLYPLRRDNTCRFVAVDFDGPAAMLDALAYAKAARASGVPAALELSQSGRGAHVWIFFTDAVPAAVARCVGTALTHEAMVLRGEMDLLSYDRLFPNQDVLPEGGLGNLIAAPLQGRRRRDGLTAFLDTATLEPYEDQWAFPSALDRLSPGDAARVAKRATRALVGAEVTAMSRSDATRVHPPLPKVVHAELGAGLSLNTTQLTPAALATFKHAASMANPKFYELQRLRKSTWDTPRFVRGYDITLDDRLVLPRGLRHSVTQLVERAGSRLALTDLRNPGREIEAQLTADLNPDQAAAVNALLAHDDGILVAPPGSGKTVMACALIAERGTSTLILVDRKALVDSRGTSLRRCILEVRNCSPQVGEPDHSVGLALSLLEFEPLPYDSRGRNATRGRLVSNAHVR
jgi:hypothetical protein